MKPNKYKAKRIQIGAEAFDSRKEAERWMQLMLLQKAGEIRELKRQVVIPLIGKEAPLKTRTGKAMRLTVDFTYEDRRLGWATVYEDAKGMPTRDYEVRRAVAQAMGIEVIET